MDYVPSKLEVAETEKWIDGFGYRAIRTSDCVQRLNRVCFLGTMQYVLPLKHNYSRYEHSLGVARLAYEYAQHWKLSEESCSHVIVVALLHDIGHLLFSHASEVFYRSRWGRYHTGHGSRLLRHLIRAFELRGARCDADEVRRAATILTGQPEKRTRSTEDRLIHEIFHGPLSADTLDGITRAAESTGLDLPKPIELIRRTFREGETVLLKGEAQHGVEDFFDLKRRIYQDFIYCSRGLAAEAMLTRALEVAFKGMSAAKEFLPLDDEDALDRVRANDEANYILTQLESGDLFCSLRDVHADKYGLVVDLYERVSGGARASIGLRRELERRFAKQMGIDMASWFIIHPVITLNMERRGASQMWLPQIPSRLNNIAGSFARSKSFGNTIGVLIPAAFAPSARLLTIPDLNAVDKCTGASSVESSKADCVEKHRGAIMTPPAIANVMVDWAISRKNARVLDPASGDGVFLRAAYRRLRELGARPRKATELIYGVEAAAEHCGNSIGNWPQEAAPTKPNVLNEDFLAVVNRNQDGMRGLDAIVGNPPYIRAHWIPEKAKHLAIGLARRTAGAELSKRASSWASHLVCSATLLKPTGRLAMLLPIELLSTVYAQPVREFLARRFTAMTFILFEKAVFPAQQDVVVLLASNEPPCGVRRLEVVDFRSLSVAALADAESMPEAVDWLSGKWTHLITDPRTIRFLGSLLESREVCRFGDLASIRLGQVTGKNKFFVLTSEAVKRHNIGKKWLAPMVSNAAAIPGAILTKKERQQQEARGDRCHALAIPTTANVTKDKDLTRYLEQGKREGYDKGHKCRTRWPWYSVPMQQPPHAFLTYMSGGRMRLVLNRAGANSTNTIHNVFFGGKLTQSRRNATVVAFYSSLTALSAELIGRAYGGGVLKLELNEARQILLPKMDVIPGSLVNKLGDLLPSVDKSIRGGDDDIFKAVDRLVLGEGLGLCDRDIQMIATERARLAARRMTRLR